MSRRNVGIAICLLVLALAGGYVVWSVWFAPTRVLVVNALPAQEAELRLAVDGNSEISLTAVATEDAGGFSDYDAVLLYGRGLYVDSVMRLELDEAAKKGVIVHTNTLRRSSVKIVHNLDSIRQNTIDTYLRNQCRANNINLFRYIRTIANPRRVCRTVPSPPVRLPDGMLYYVDEGVYFSHSGEFEDYLRAKGVYRDGAAKVALVSGVTFPVEGARGHIDTLMARLTDAGYNVYPFSASGRERERLLREIKPDAVVYLPMGRLGSDSIVNALYDEDTPLFAPFPVTVGREEWLDAGKSLGAGTITSRIVLPEIDGAMASVCISTQNPDGEGRVLPTPESERVDAFMKQMNGFMRLRTKLNSDKRVAVAYFKSPGKDALLASGMEVVPSLYNFLKRLRDEGYDLTGLPQTLEEFRRDIMKYGAVMGDYAPQAQQRFMNECSPLWIDRHTYEKWAREMLLPEKYDEVTARYGNAPGTLLARNDSIAVACLRYGNIFLFPQPRAAIGDDDFRIVHGADVAPPHSHIAPYLYVSKGFMADLLIHFGTHGNLEFTPGKDVALSGADWADVLTGHIPHFYFYTTANVGESVIARRRSHAVLVSHLTPPYVESGMRCKYASLIERLHKAMADSSANTVELKREIVALGLHSDLRLDSLSTAPYTAEELSKIDLFVEELANEKVTGAFYVMGMPYSSRDLLTTLQAICADGVAYSRACRDFEKGIISEHDSKDYGYVAHHYLDDARQSIADLVAGNHRNADGMDEVEECLHNLLASTGAEIDAMVGAMSGRPVRPAPGGDPVLNPNVLPTGRNMFSVNPEITPGKKAWSDGVSLAEATLRDYKNRHGEYPKKVSYTFWAGEFISTEGATIAQALRMMGVEPVRDSQGRVMGLRLTPSEELGRPRVNIIVQVSGQLRDIASSRLKMLTEAVRMASEARDDIYPNYVAIGTTEQEKALLLDGNTPERAKALSVMRVFGPVNSGYSTGMLYYTENSGEWEDKSELADGFINNMCAVYGDDDEWGSPEPALFGTAISGTKVTVQPRQSNTWGPLSLDHVYEFTGALSLAVDRIDGEEPEAVMADYRNRYIPRVQDTKEAVAVETRATVLNPVFISERMKGDASTAQMFGEIFRNIFGWTVTRPSALTEGVYDDLYDVYVADCHSLGIKDYFDRVNPVALQEMTATMLESARKGYWKASGEQLRTVAGLNAELTARHGAPCTEFVCGNRKLQEFTASLLDDGQSVRYLAAMASTIDTDIEGERHGNFTHDIFIPVSGGGRWWMAVLILLSLVAIIGVVVYRRKK